MRKGSRRGRSASRSPRGPGSPGSRSQPSSPPPLPPRRHISRGLKCKCDPVEESSGWVSDMLEIHALEAKGAQEVGGGGEIRMRLFTGTWNTAGRIPTSASQLGEWLNPELDDRGRPPDVIAIGLQELVELTPGTVVVDSFTDVQSRANCQKWLSLIQEYMGDYGEKNGTRYFVVTDQRLLGTYLVLLCTIDFRSKISDVQRSHVATGARGMLGNKGSVAIRFRVCEKTSLCIVCSHMAAHRDAVAARNEEFRTVSSRPLFTDFCGAEAGDDVLRKDFRMGGLAGLLSAMGTPSNPSTRADSRRADNGADPVGGSGVPKLTVLDHDVCFWMGDLNYRVVEKFPVSAVMELINGDNLEVLREMDQLNCERTAGRAFEVFYEGPLSFPPTYKVIPGTAEYDMRPEKKIRCPSWCDRILWTIGYWGGDAIRRMALNRYWRSGPLLSDHLPVSAVFDCAFVTSEVHPDVERLAIEQLMSEWQMWSSLGQEGSSAGGVIEIAPPALSVRHIDRSARLRLSLQLFSTLPFQVEYHVCDHSVPKWLGLSVPSGLIEASTSPLSASSAVLEMELSPQEISSEDGASLTCALLHVVFTGNRREIESFSQTQIVPVICTLI